MKFKVGDRVRFIGDYSNHTTDYDGQSLKNFIKNQRNILCIDSIYPTYINVKGNDFWCFKERELELIEYTYKDLRESPIGTKVTFENGIILTKTEEDFYENDVLYRNNENLEALKDNINLGKIIKIEEPEYSTVYEYKPEILDEIEKRYLRNVISPYLDRIKSIVKFIFSTGRAKITIIVKDDNRHWYIDLPPFERDAMYKNMEDDKEYTIEELGL